MKILKLMLLVPFIATSAYGMDYGSDSEQPAAPFDYSTYRTEQGNKERQLYKNRSHEAKKENIERAVVRDYLNTKMNINTTNKEIANHQQYIKTWQRLNAGNLSDSQKARHKTAIFNLKRKQERAQEGYNNRSAKRQADADWHSELQKYFY